MNEGNTKDNFSSLERRNSFIFNKRQASPRQSFDIFSKSGSMGSRKPVKKAASSFHYSRPMNSGTTIKQNLS
jgi:hypothetical protein